MVVFVLMGVCGSGKTTVAEELGKRLKCGVRDADEFHSSANKQKMSEGVPLTDEDRFPWLLTIHDYIQSLIDKDEIGVVTCSALKRKYREILSSGTAIDQQRQVVFLYLKGNIEVINKRIDARKNHFMPPSLLKSQFVALEEPGDDEKHYTVDINRDLHNVLEDIWSHIVPAYCAISSE